MIWRRFAFILVIPTVFALLSSSSPAAHAACTGPDGAAGHVFYNADYARIQYCDGTNWVTSGGGCVPDWSAPSIISEVASGVTAETEFGSEGNGVAIAGKYAVIGARFDDTKGVDAGAAWVYEHRGGSWVEVQKLFGSDTATGNEFGLSVDISGSFIIVGGRLNSSNRGAAYIFQRQRDGTWKEISKLAPSELNNGDQFGYDVGIDNSGWAVVGAPWDDDAGGNEGTIYIFERQPTGLWTQHSKKNVGATTDQRFGLGVAIDGFRIIAVGNDNDAKSGDNDILKIYEYDGANWNSAFQFNHPRTFDGFGNRSLAINGDWAFAGERNADEGATDIGIVYVFHRDSGGTWQNTQTFQPSGAVGDDHFGSSVGISGEYALIGSYGNGGNGADSGAAFIYKLNKVTNQWGEVTKLNYPTSNAAGDELGYSVALNGNVALAAAPRNATAGTNAGQVYFYNGCGVDGCTSPDGADGTIMYNSTHEVLQYCNGSVWTAMGPVPGAGGAGCANPSGTAGALLYNTSYNVLQYCDGTNWIGIGK